MNGLYIISDNGEIISLPRYKQNNSKLQYVEPKEICRYENPKNHYIYVQLWKDGRYKNIRLHRLVAENFIENKLSLSEVNHKDGNRSNNNVENLEWVTSSENQIHSYKNKLQTVCGRRKKIILQYDKNGNFIKEWTGIRNAAKKLKICGGRISACCKGKRKTVGNYIWRYKEGFDV